MKSTGAPGAKAVPRPRLGIFGGTFDPVHLGHLILAHDALEQWRLDAIVFVPCAQSPHKAVGARATGAQRLSLLRRALRGEPRFRLFAGEVRRGPPSYAIDTLGELRGLYPQARFTWLIGADQVPRLTEWHNFAALDRAVRWAVFDRGGIERPELAGATALPFLRLPRPRQIDISATEIRARVKAHLPIAHLVPPAVAGLIEREKLYL